MKFFIIASLLFICIALASSCEENFYADGETCLPCPADKPFSDAGSLSLAACRCAYGSYFSSASTCEPCPSGLVCADGLTTSSCQLLFSPNSTSTSCSPQTHFIGLLCDLCIVIFGAVVISLVYYAKGRHVLKSD